MPKYMVIAEFIDIENGQRKYPGDIIEADGGRIDRLKKAGVIGAEIIEAEPEEQAPADNPVTEEPEAIEPQPEEMQAHEKAAPVKQKKARGG